MDFVSGKLEGEQERQFAEEFAYNESFRKGFRNYLAVTGTISTNISKLGPPPNITAAVYAGLGFNSSLPAQPETVSLPKTSFFTKPLFTGFVSSVVSIVVSVTVMYLAFNPGNNGASIADKSLTNLTGANNRFPVVSSFESNDSKEADRNLTFRDTKSRANHTSINSHLNSGNIPIDEKIDGTSTHKENYTDNRDLKSPAYKNEFTGSSNLSILSPVNISTDSFSPPYPTGGFHAPNNSFIFSEINNRGAISFDDFQIAIRKTSASSLSSETVESTGNQEFNNLGISLFYELSEEFSVGLEISQESFFVSYKGRDSANNQVRYDQKPNLTSLGILLKFNPNIEIIGLEPTVQVSAGGSYYGITARAGAGFEYQIYPGLNIILQAEYSNLFFRHHKTINSAGKAGLSYGILYKF